MLDGPEQIYDDRERSFRRGQSNSDPGLHPGSRLPAHATAMGKLLLAYLPEEERRTLLAEIKLSKREPNTITSKQALLDELDAIREEGVAVNDEELAAGLYAIAAPVRNEAREVIAAVSLAAHTSMISLAELVDALSPHLISTADRVSARLGYRRDDE
ncbi:MAG: IclR family transcriptional regulator [Solirubrobacteraceae bacterium]